MHKKEDAIKYARDFLSACQALPISIDRAILFGSAINGNANEESDIDLALFSTSFSDDLLRNIDLIALANIRFPNLDIHTYPTAAFAGNGLLLDEIKRTGMELSM
jgi:predicted nucleotidyltransferase